MTFSDNYVARGIMRAFLLPLVLVLTAACGAVEDRNSDKAIEDMLASSSLPEEGVHRARLFDEMAFPSASSRYYSIVDRANLINIIPRKYMGTVSDDRPLFNPVKFRLRQFFSTRFFVDIRAPAEAELLLLGLDDINAEKLSEHRDILVPFLGESSFASALQQAVFSDNDRCALLRLTDGYKIQKTLVLVAFDMRDEASREEQKAAVSCINRGHYYHLGYSSAATMPAENFVGQNRYTKSFIMNSKYQIGLPYILTDGSFAGKERHELMAAVIEIMEKDYPEK
ncbi:hypothetical protein [Kordiimonas sp.]|uniref:hypothetical protein n=1 Tax=Kordiimonas sp. TaxID=1970157 RepID=UPI003A92AFAE